MYCPGPFNFTYVPDIPPEYTPTSKFQGTLGHKVNHGFTFNTKYIDFDSPRFGIIRAVETLEDIEENDEFLVDYSYDEESPSLPKWYKELYKKYLQEQVLEILELERAIQSEFWPN